MLGTGCQASETDQLGTLEGQREDKGAELGGAGDRDTRGGQRAARPSRALQAAGRDLGRLLRRHEEPLEGFSDLPGCSVESRLGPGIRAA